MNTAATVSRSPGNSVITINEQHPADGGGRGSLNPPLSVTVQHAAGKPMTITFSTDASGQWKEIKRFSRVGNGTYRVSPRDMTQRDRTYQWAVDVSAGKHSVRKEFRFDMVNHVGSGKEIILSSDCHKYGCIKHGWEKGKFFVTIQRGMWAAYDLDKGWYRTFQCTFKTPEGVTNVPYSKDWDKDLSHVGHPFWGYWNGLYHVVGAHKDCSEWVGAESRTFEGFRELMAKDAVASYCLHGVNSPDGSSYTFSNDRAWIMSVVPDATQDAVKVYVRYWEWTKVAGWKEPVTIGSLIPNRINNAHVAMIRHTRDIWYVYVVEGPSVYTTHECSSTLKYFKSTDGGKTWDSLQDTGLPAHTVRSYPAFARYGDNYYVFLSHENSTVIYYSKDAENWDKNTRRSLSPGVSMKPHGTLLHQSALIFTANKNESYIDDQYGFIAIIPELLSKPETPTAPSPENGARLNGKAGEINLAVKVHGPQTYDVAFYWEDGTFIGEDKLLREGDLAQVTVKGLAAGKTYEWYAVARGALLEYYGNEPDTVSDEVWTKTRSFKVGNPLAERKGDATNGCWS